ncbi:HTH domain-containing protein [Methanotorris formicicus]|uniref:Helix-turn-helix type 11 domain protein n=1 Tax=Methanotorris formicicus Mc-S-70 TaxID=647171 RepID=H1L0Q1_9EURY|nr:HTH domain-containing protein [Methanotorris formicicus]EHP84518.1 helix-turn-helix type 11 domain protein [Methanotorris formicicus Mc-S-70]
MSENKLNVEREIKLMANRKDFDFWEFLKKAYESDVKLDIGHFIILNILIGVGELYKRLSEEIGKNQAQKILEKKGIFTKNSEYVSGEYLKKFIGRSSRVAVHNRIRDLKNLGFEIEGKSGPLGGYKLIKTPEWFQ